MCKILHWCTLDAIRSFTVFFRNPRRSVWVGLFMKIRNLIAKHGTTGRKFVWNPSENVECMFAVNVRVRESIVGSAHTLVRYWMCRSVCCWEKYNWILFDFAEHTTPIYIFLLLLSVRRDLKPDSLLAAHPSWKWSVSYKSQKVVVAFAPELIWWRLCKA